MKITRINWEKTIILSFLFAIIGIATGGIIEHSFPDAYGASRHDLKNIKIKINQAEDKVEYLESKIEQQKTTISDKEEILTQKQNILRELRKIADDSSSHKNKISDAKKAIRTAEKSLKDENKKYIDFFNEKSQQVKTIQSLESLLVKSEKLLKLQGLDNKIIGIELSKTCITLIKNNMDSACPTYEELLLLDDSNTDISGRFIYDESGFYHRDTPQLQNSHRWYDFVNYPILIVDPPSGYNLSTIEILPNLDTYVMAQSNVSTENFSRTIYHDRYIDSCKTAKINSANWKFLLPDTIAHMRSGCTESSTNYDEVEIIFTPLTPIDITQSPNYQYEQWLIHSKELCKVKC